MMDATGIEKVIAVIEDMRMTGIIEQWAIGGAFAATLLDEPIATIDLDIFFLLGRAVEPGAIVTLTEVYDYAKSRGFSFDHEFINIYGWLVQFVEASHNVLWKDAISDARSVSIGSFEVPVIRPYYLAAMWLSAGRQKDFQKMAQFFDNGLLEIEEFEKVVVKYDLEVKWDREKHRFGKQ